MQKGNMRLNKHTEIVLMEYRTNEHGGKTALVKSLRVWCQVLMMTDGLLKLRQVRRIEERYMTPLERHGRLYPMARALRVFHKHGRQYGISPAARRFLTEAGR